MGVEAEVGHKAEKPKVAGDGSTLEDTEPAESAARRSD